MGKTPGDDKAEPQLELPSLRLPGLRRRKRSRDEAPPDVERATAPETQPAVEPPYEPTSGPAPSDAPTEQMAPVLAPEPTAASHASVEPAEGVPAGASKAGSVDTQILPGTDEDAHEEPRKGFALPSVPGRLAAALTGLVVGAAGASATMATMVGCEAVRGVSTCGGAPGFFILVAILVLMILLGAGLLKALGVHDSASTSFLAVGVVTVVAMLTLLEVIFSAWMFVVIPVLAALSYLLAHWVTTRFEDEPTGRRDWT